MMTTTTGPMGPICSMQTTIPKGLNTTTYEGLLKTYAYTATGQLKGGPSTT
jgi:hypothetical protein